MTTFDQIGLVLRLLREKQGRAQAEVARAVGLPNSTLSRYESQALVPSLANLGKVLAALDVDLGELGAALDAANGRLPREEEPQPVTFAGPKNGWAPQERAVAELVVGAMRGLRPEGRQAFTDALDALQRLSRVMRPASGPEDGEEDS